jgi:hypothetical protein
VRVASGEMEAGIAFCWRVGARELGCGVFGSGLDVWR